MAFFCPKRSAPAETVISHQGRLERSATEPNPHIKAVRANWRSLEQVPEAERTREVIAEALRENWGALQYLVDGCDDKDLLLDALAQDPLAFQFGSERLRQDREVVLKAVQGNGLLLEDAHEHAREQRDVVLAAVEQNGLALQFASEALRADADIVAVALETEPLAFEYANEALFDNRVLVLAAVSKEWRVLQLLVEHPLLADHEVALAAVRNSGEALLLLPTSCHSHAIVLEAARASRPGSDALNCVEESLFEDREFVMQLMGIDGLLLRLLPARFREDPAVCIMALTQTRHAKKYIAPVLWSDHEFAERASCSIEASRAHLRQRRLVGGVRSMRKMTARGVDTVP